MKSYSVSIITPSYNQGQFIEETIASVLSQDYPHIEYIVVDGGSTDNTIDILKKYDSQITWISEMDNGQADAINKGFKMATGDILYWINSDDILLPNAVSSVVKVFEKNPDVDAIYGKCHFTDINGKIIGKYPTEKFNFKRLAQFNFICQPSVFFRKTGLFQSGLLDETLNYALDYDLWIRMAKQFRFKYFPEFLSCYRLHDSSKTVDKKQATQNTKEVLDVVVKHYNWAPANRVYSYFYQLFDLKLKIMGNYKPFLISTSLFTAVLCYIKINKRIVIDDIKIINMDYVKKIGVDWNDLYKTY